MHLNISVQVSVFAEGIADMQLLCRPRIVECLLTLKRLHEGEQRETDANVEVVKNKALKPFTPVRTDNMRPFLAPAAARATSPLRRTPSPTPHPPPADYATNTASPDINYEAVTSQFFSHTPGEFILLVSQY